MKIQDDEEISLLHPADEVKGQPLGCIGTTMLKLKTNKTILLWCIAAILSSVMQSVFLVLAGEVMPNFSYFFFWFTAGLFVIVYGFMLAVVWLFTKQITASSK